MEREMTDIHMHLIPGVDDGAADLNMAQVMLIRAREQGIRCIFATPHSSAFDYYGPDTVAARFRQLRAVAARYFPEIALFPGCEVFCEKDRMPETVGALRRVVYWPMGNTRWVLAEFSKWIYPEDAVFCVKALTEAGFHPIVAHVERYAYLQGKMEIVERLLEAGAKLQINAYSLAEEQDAAIRDWARTLAEGRKVFFLGSDAHNTYSRPPSARTGLDWLYAHTDPEYADAVARKNAERLLKEWEGEKKECN